MSKNRTTMNSALPVDTVLNQPSNFDGAQPNLNISSASSSLTSYVVSDVCKVSHTRMVLTAAQAEEIYQKKISMIKMQWPTTCSTATSSLLRGRSVPVSSMFDVSPKTIRDIWNMRTGQRATCHLWQYDDDFGLKQDRETNDGVHFQVNIQFS